LGKTESELLNLQDFNIELAPGETMTIAGKTASSTTNIAGGLSWEEDF